MKKTLIAAAVAAAVAAPSANAGVVIYGKIHNSIDYLNENASGMTNALGLPVKGWQVTSRASRLGFKGSEDLGNGLKAIWKIEMAYDTANGGSVGGSSRNTYIGLSGDWGTFLVGRHDTPYKMAFYSTGIDMMGDSIADANAMFGYHEVRASNAIAYVSPNFNGLTIAAAIVPGEGAQIGVTPLAPVVAGVSPWAQSFRAGNGLTDAYSLGVMYKNNGLKLAFGYEDLSFGANNNNFTAFGFPAAAPGVIAWDDKKFFVGAGYSMNGFDIAAGYQDREQKMSAFGFFAKNELKSYSLSLGYTFGNNKVIGMIGKTSLDVSENFPAVAAASADADSWALGFEHKFSKRTKAYAVYASSELGLGGAANTFVSPVTAGKGFSLGMIHNF